MPFVPNVHIVGDESDEAVEVNPDVLSNNNNLAANPIVNGRPVEESETSESTEDDETDEKESDSSSDEGADWSMDVTHIARTPERYSSTISQETEETMDNNETPMNIDMESVQDASENSSESAERKNTTLSTDSQSSPCNSKDDKSLDEKDESQTNKDSIVDPTNNVDNEKKLVDRECESPKGVLATDLQISSSNSESDVTIDEKDEGEAKKLSIPGLHLPYPTTTPSQFKELSLSRLRLPATTADYSTPPTIGGRVAKRARRGVVQTQPQSADIEHLFAKPLDVTMYFQELSAKLVKSRVKLMPFLGLRHRIDSLVDQAMSQN